MYVPHSSWISSILYLHTEDGSTYLAVFIADDHAPTCAGYGRIPVAMLYKDVPAWLPGLLMAGRVGKGSREKESIGRVYNRLVRGKYLYERVEGKEKVRELRRLMEKGKET